MIWGLIVVVGGVILVAVIVSHVRGKPSHEVYRDTGDPRDKKPPANPWGGGGGFGT